MPVSVVYAFLWACFDVHRFRRRKHTFERLEKLEDVLRADPKILATRYIGRRLVKEMRQAACHVPSFRLSLFSRMPCCRLFDFAGALFV